MGVICPFLSVKRSASAVPSSAVTAMATFSSGIRAEPVKAFTVMYPVSGRLIPPFLVVPYILCVYMLCSAPKGRYKNC